MSPNDLRAVAMLGMVGHGKTRLLNQLCGTRHPSNAQAKSCTQTLQHGRTRRQGICIIDTPGIGSSEEIAAHIAGQKAALEGIPLSGVYAVVKSGRADDIVRVVESIMDFVGSDDIRVIVTHSDVALKQEGFDECQLKAIVADNLNIPVTHIMLTGLDTAAEKLEDFVASTLHRPIEFRIDEVQVAALAGLSGVSRKFNKPIKAITSKIEAATKACERIISCGKNRETDLVIIRTQAVVSEEVAAAKDKIFRDAFDLPSLDQQNLIYGKAGLCLSLALQKHVQVTNKLLTWDVSDPRDPRNHYRKCPNCDAVYVKVAGCVNVYKCGGNYHVPDAEQTTTYGFLNIWFVPSGASWEIRFGVDGQEHAEVNILTAIARAARRLVSSTDRDCEKLLEQAKQRGSRQLNIYCGQQVSWDVMHPLTDEQLAQLGNVEVANKGELEKISSVKFNEHIRKFQSQNQQRLGKIRP